MRRLFNVCDEKGLSQSTVYNWINHFRIRRRSLYDKLRTTINNHYGRKHLQRLEIPLRVSQQAGRDKKNFSYMNPLNYHNIHILNAQVDSNSCPLSAGLTLATLDRNGLGCKLPKIRKNTIFKNFMALKIDTNIYVQILINFAVVF